MALLRPITVVLAIVLTALLAGCDSSSRTSGPDVTGGFALRMFATLEEDSFAAYRLEQDGTLSFAGGEDALNHEYSWSGPMTEDEIASLLALIETQRWWESDPASSFVPPQRSFDVRLARSNGKPKSKRFKVIGDSPGVVELYTLLETAARRRHEEFLETLPKPGFQKP